jgi:glycosyltransferase involved in cell wall biosynthesis
MPVSIIIPVFNDADGLQVTLKSIKQHLGGKQDIEIIVCNDGGGVNISQIAASYGVREVLFEHNKGSYAARNRGIEASQENILVFLDADQRITEGWLDAGLASLNDADYAGGQIKVVTSDRPSVWELFDARTAFPVKAFLETLHFAPTANLFIHKRIIDKVGNFNEDLRSGGDRDFGIRVFNNGFKQIYVSNAITLHPARNRKEQLMKLKRIANGYVELSLLVQDKNQLVFILQAFRKFIQVPVEIIWRSLRYPFFDYWQNGKTRFNFIILGKLRKLIYFWHLMICAIEIAIINNPQKIDKAT